MTSRPLPSSNYYDTTIRMRASHSRLMGHEVADVCIIGGGIAGCSAALELAERGYRVVLLEAEHIGWGASGRSGGQIIPGYACEQTTMDGLVGQADAKRLWDTSIEAIQLLRERIDRHEIDCDWRTGHLQVGIKDRHRSALHRWHETLRAKYDYRSTRVLDRSELGSLVATDRYCAGLHDNAAGHLHPLKYTLGLARAAANAGAHLYEHSAATDIQRGPTVRVRTAEGCVSAQYVVLCGNAYLKNLVPQLSARIMPIGTYIIATEPLGEARARQLIADDSAVTDTNFILDYFRRSADHRLLFGGRVSYSGHDVFDTAHATAKRMLRVFPQLTSAKVEYAWAGNLDITMNRAPDFGRVEPNIYYLQGFSGHGLALTGMAGKLVAEAIAGQAERFDIFGKIEHRHFPGGRLLRTPTLVLAMLWYRLRDLL